MPFSEHAEVILRARYFRKDPETRKSLETTDQLLWRVANAVAKAEKPEERDGYARYFHDAMAEQRFLPNSPTLMNAGMDFGDMCACVVLGIHDSMESIYGTLYNQAMLHRFGVGTGFDFSELREKHAFVYKTMGEASGPVSFLKVYDASTNEIKQGGRRRGANMATLRFDHPDIEEFITCKDPANTKITNFNISMTLEDEHMIAVEKDLEIDLVSPAGKKVVGSKNARTLLKLAAQNAWATGDPGVMFLSAMNRANPTPGIGRLVTSNPCSESQLLENEECTLASLNLERYVLPGNHPMNLWDWPMLERDVRLVARFLDDVVEVNYYINDDLKKMHKEGNRKIGIGVMGWADALIRLRIPYESEQAYALGDEIMGFINRTAHDEDRVLAEERGVFPNYEHYAFADKWGKQRNAHVTVIAPTGTIAVLADCSSGVEPLFAITMERTGLDNHTFVMVNPLFAEYAKECNWPQEVIDHVMKTGRLSDCDHPSVKSVDKQIWATAHDVTWKGHLNMLAAFQKHVDNGVSKTINLPEDATPEDIYNIYLTAWKMGLKTVSVYRDKSKSVQVLSAGVTKDTVAPAVKKADRPEILDGKTHKVKTDLGPAYITINSFDGVPAELFANVGRNGSAVQTMSEALGRVVSVALQHGVAPEALSRTLYGVGGNGNKLMSSVPSAIAKVLGNGHFSEIAAAKEPVPVVASRIQGDICPECHQASLVPTGDCSYCSNCGYSKC
jgi:ribonucleoside-diphosphate reductase alpha chain